MTVTGTATAATTSVTLPAHAVGNVIFIFAYYAANSPGSKPTASGTVPNWNLAQSAGANLLSLTAAWFVATATNHTSGTWTSATNMIAMVMAPDLAANTLGVGVSSAGNANNTQTIVYPALTLSTLIGTSWGVRCGSRVTAASTVSSAPTGWTNRAVQPTGSSALMAVCTAPTMTTNPTSDSVSTAGSNAAYRAYTIEVTEVPPFMAHLPVGVIQAVKRSASY